MRWLLVALLSLILAVLSGCTRSRLWDKYSKNGKKAFEPGRYAEAEKLLLSALKEAEGFGPPDPRTATSLNNLGALYEDEGKYTEAEPLFASQANVIKDPHEALTRAVLDRTGSAWNLWTCL